MPRRYRLSQCEPRTGKQWHKKSPAVARLIVFDDEGDGPQRSGREGHLKVAIVSNQVYATVTPFARRAVESVSAVRRIHSAPIESTRCIAFPCGCRVSIHTAMHIELRPGTQPTQTDGPLIEPFLVEPAGIEPASEQVSPSVLLRQLQYTGKPSQCNRRVGIRCDPERHTVALSLRESNSGKAGNRNPTKPAFLRAQVISWPAEAPGLAARKPPQAALSSLVRRYTQCILMKMMPARSP